jgi:hypothetical protein
MVLIAGPLSGSEVPGILKTWYCRRMEKISWTDRVRKEVLHRFKEERDIVKLTTRMKTDWFGHFLLRNCRLKHDGSI